MDRSVSAPAHQSVGDFRVVRQRLLIQPNCLCQPVLRVWLQHYRTSPQNEIERIRTGRAFLQAARCLDVGKADVEGGSHSDDDLLLS
jgi:hypothetical protein